MNPFLKQMGIEVELTLTKDGYYPYGGGEVSLNFAKVTPFCYANQFIIQNYSGIKKNILNL